MDVKVTLNTKHIPPNKLADVDLTFEDGEPMVGITITGIAIWESRNSDTPWVSFPARSYKSGRETKYYNYFRADHDTLNAFRDEVLAEYDKAVEAGEKGKRKK